MKPHVSAGRFFKPADDMQEGAAHIQILFRCPVQQPRIPVWVAGRWATRRRPLDRALRWDGFFPIEVPEPAALAELVEEVRERRGEPGSHFDIVAEVPPGEPTAAWEAAGATWLLTDIGSQPRLSEVEALIETGPADY